VKTFNPHAVGSKTKLETLVFKSNIKVFAVDLRRVIFAFDCCRVEKPLNPFIAVKTFEHTR